MENRHMARPGTGGPANFKLYTRPLSTIDSDFKKTLGKPLDLRTIVDAEVEVCPLQTRTIRHKKLSNFQKFAKILPCKFFDLLVNANSPVVVRAR